MQLFQYQKEFVDWAEKNNSEGKKFIYLADEQGLGKTIQAITYASKFRKILIICPAILKINWLNEILASGDKGVITVIGASKEIINNCKWLIVNYDIASKTKFITQILDNFFDLIILDEVHYLKNQDSARTKGILGCLTEGVPGIVGSSIYVLALSGTPVPNRPIELFPLLNRLSPDTIDNYGYWEYGMRYCKGKQGPFGFDVSGASNLDMLNKKLKSIMLRRTKDEVLEELPEKTYRIISFPITHRAIKEVIFKEKEYAEEVLKDFTASISLPGLSELRKEMGLLKVKIVFEYITNSLAGDLHKIVIFGYHKLVLTELFHLLTSYNPVLVNGDVNVKDRQIAIDKFQKDPSVRVFIGNITSAGIGITLTASSHVIFIEPSWVPAELDQASDRCHRIGQKNNVLIEFLVFEGSLDEYILKKIFEKNNVIGKILSK